MEHFIKEIRINNVRHLKDISISLGGNHRQHLILTGGNGSGKTSVLNEIANNLMFLNKSEQVDLLKIRRTLRQLRISLQTEKDEDERKLIAGQISSFESSLSAMRCPETGIDVIYNHEEDLPSLYRSGEFITAFFVAARQSNDIASAHGVEEIRLPYSMGITESPARDIMKYMVHLKTQQAYAKNENDIQNERYIGEWFDRFEEALRMLLDDDSIELKYDYKNYSFVIQQKNRNPSSLNELSDGYSSILRILSDLIMRMDQNWLHKNQLSEYNKEGVVLIDEVETHLHIELQRKILPFLTKFFPRLQFIVSTHSPIILQSIGNVVIYDLENRTLVNQPQGLTDVPYNGIVESYFNTDKLSASLREKYDRFKELVSKEVITDGDIAEIAELEVYLDEIPDYLAWDISTEYKRLKSEFEAREDL